MLYLTMKVFDILRILRNNVIKLGRFLATMSHSNYIYNLLFVMFCVCIIDKYYHY